MCFLSKAQDYADAEKYLIDSLDLSTLSSKDKQLIDSALILYDQCNGQNESEEENHKKIEFALYSEKESLHSSPMQFVGVSEASRN